MDRLFCALGIHCWGNWVEYDLKDPLNPLKRLDFFDRYRVCMHCGLHKHNCTGGPGMA